MICNPKPRNRVQQVTLPVNNTRDTAEEKLYRNRTVPQQPTTHNTHGDEKKRREKPKRKASRKPETRNPKPETRNPKPETRTREPETGTYM